MTEQPETAGVITVFYDGACPRCRKERARYEKLAGNSGVQWLDITGQEDTLREQGIDPQGALLQLHVRDRQGRIQREMDAYRLLLSQISWLRPLAWLIGLLLVRPLLSWCLTRWVNRRLRKDGRLPGQSCSPQGGGTQPPGNT
ncbi:MAG: DUF393 domain-containing protein [Halomonadaceae bacterium]|nr:MAG: DUF393 domain-containing protein [Halomonadaceae bacterium]